ncbi:hypothetical protein BC940DRAFT_291867 [Gongronella butleri]|nr:hypothetical protein BC940DRAFT_291867 [Gongronella butleri]
MSSHRRGIKFQPSERQNHWRGKFHTHCQLQAKRARQGEVEQRRLASRMDQWMLEEWHQFQRENQQALAMESPDIVEDLQALVEHHIAEDDYGDLLYEDEARQEQEELERYVAQYEAMAQHPSSKPPSQPRIACVLCHQGSYVPTAEYPGRHQCDACGHKISEQALHAIYTSLAQHAAECPGQLGLGVDPTDPECIMGICSTCDSWLLF